MNSSALATRGRMLDLGEGRPSRGVGDVLGDRAVEEEDVLLDDPQQPAVALDLDVAEVDAVEPDHARGRVVEPGDQVAEGRLARPAAADQRDRLARARRRGRCRGAPAASPVGYVNPTPSSVTRPRLDRLARPRWLPASRPSRGARPGGRAPGRSPRGCSEAG